MRLSTKGRYGVRAMYELAYHYGEGPVSIKEIAETQDFSDSYIEQLFAILKKAGIILSIRGSKGGYILARAPEEITVGEIIRALEGPIEIANCAGGRRGYVCGKASGCATRGLWQDVAEAINDVIDNRTLKDLLNE